MLTARPSAHRYRTKHRIARLMLCALLAVTGMGNPPPPADAAETAASLSTGIVPTMGLNDVTEGALLFRTNQAGRFTPAPILKTDVQIAITGTIARATVRQEFTNPSTRKGDWLEGIYVFPLPETAAVDHLRMKIGERIIEGQIKEQTAAKKVYEQAKQEGKRTSLVEQERPNIFTTSVANIGPGEHVTIEIEYQETVRYENEQFQLRFPMAVGQRYIHGTPVIIDLAVERELGTGKQDLRPLATEIRDQLRAWLSPAPPRSSPPASPPTTIRTSRGPSSTCGSGPSGPTTPSAPAPWSPGPSPSCATPTSPPPVPSARKRPTPTTSSRPASTAPAPVKILPGAASADWLAAWLPQDPVLTPTAMPADAHISGLNFSRSWGLWSLYQASDNLIYRDLFVAHVTTHLNHPQYWAEDYNQYADWVAQFGVYAISQTYAP